VPERDAALTSLVDQARRDHTRWINGDAGGYTLPEDGTILGAVGGYAVGGADTAQRQGFVASHWLRGTGEIEFVNGGSSPDIAWITFIERSRVVFRDADSERRWDLRVTEVFRRRGNMWERVHRHADPLVDRRSVSAAADLLAAE
jgi:hypothetical protein